MHTPFSWICVVVWLGITSSSGQVLRCYDCDWRVGVDLPSAGLEWCKKPTTEHLPSPRPTSGDSPAVGTDSNGTNGAWSNGTAGVDHSLTTKSNNTQVCVTLTVQLTNEGKLGMKTCRRKKTVQLPEKLVTDQEICKPGQEFEELFPNDLDIEQYFEQPQKYKVLEICLCFTDGCNNRKAAGGIVQMSSPVLVTLLLFLTCCLLSP